ncbi:MAG: metallophosphoesterase [Acutalibacteraceae bacterium]
MNDERFKPILRFAVMSDVHIREEQIVERERFRKGVADAYKIAQSADDYKSLDAIVIAGDFANHGTELEMQYARDILDDEMKDSTELIILIASHEYNSNLGGVEGANERLKRIMGVDYDTHKVIKGFHFVAASTSKGVDYDESKRNWVREQLNEAKKDDPKKPIFMFQHPHVSGTVYGSIGWGNSHLLPAYMDFPQLLVFSGHSHAPINDPRSIHQKHFTCLGTGTFSYFELDEFDKITGTTPESGKQAAQMLIVEVDAQNRVRVYPYDIITGNFFNSGWKIDVPSDPETFIYTDKKRYAEAKEPYFTPDAEIEATDITENGATVTFTQAKEDDWGFVNSYDIILRTKADNVIVAQQSRWSDYYLYDMPKTCSFRFDNLKPDTIYTAKITANGFFNNESSNYLTVEFKTK